MNKFKAGDKVVRLETSLRLVRGETYTVSWVSVGGDTITLVGHEQTYWAVKFAPLADWKVQTGNAKAEAGGGSKDDSGKRDVTLLFDDMPNALYAVTEVLQWAITKKQPAPYERGSWQGVDNFQQRYRAAMLRHVLDAAISAQSTGTAIETQVDGETQLLQLAHQATDALFQLEMAIRKSKENKSV